MNLLRIIKILAAIDSFVVFFHLLLPKSAWWLDGVQIFSLTLIGLVLGAMLLVDYMTRYKYDKMS